MAIGTTALIGLTALRAGMEIYSGYQQSAEIETQAEYNAKTYEQQAKMIESQKGLEAYQQERAIRKARGTGIARTAGAGLLLSGSSLAKLIDTETQMRLDKEIGQYNLEVQRKYALSSAAEYRRQGRVGARAALLGGYTNAFTSLLQIASMEEK